MKNIYGLPTDKTSRLISSGKEFNILKISVVDKRCKNIYITSDEEIKEGDWVLMFDNLGNLFLCDKPQQYLGIEKGHHLNKGLRKIILTTDQDLIKDGVQAIENEFLEWFVRNPNCKWVEVQKFNGFAEDYLISIPKEEAKRGYVKSETEFLGIFQK